MVFFAEGLPLMNKRWSRSPFSSGSDSNGDRSLMREAGRNGWRHRGNQELRKLTRRATAARRKAASTAATTTTTAISIKTKIPPPAYKTVDNYICPLFLSCTVHNWESVKIRCKQFPSETFLFFANATLAGTALHFCSMPGTDCPVDTLATLLDVNPHAVTLKSAYYRPYEYGATPLHFICDAIYQPFHFDNLTVLQLFVQAAIKSHDTFATTNTITAATATFSPPPNDWSPLYLAASHAARPENLHLLLSSRIQHGVPWIAPYTGAESYWQLRQQHKEWVLSQITSDMTAKPSTNDPCDGLSASDRIRKQANRFISELKFPEKSPLQALYQYIIDSEHVLLLESGDHSIPFPTRERMCEITFMMLTFPNLVPSIHKEALRSATTNVGSTKKDKDDDCKMQQRHLATLQAWIQIMVLLRPAVCQHSRQSVVAVTAGMYHSIPGLFQLACQLFPCELSPTVPIPSHRVNKTQQQHLKPSPSSWSFYSKNENMETDTSYVSGDLHYTKSTSGAGRKIVFVEPAVAGVNSSFHDLILTVSCRKSNKSKRLTHDILSILCREKPDALCIPGFYVLPPELQEEKSSKDDDSMQQLLMMMNGSFSDDTTTEDIKSDSMYDDPDYSWSDHRHSFQRERFYNDDDDVLSKRQRRQKRKQQQSSSASSFLYYPFSLAALQNARLDTIFTILSHCPHALQLQRQPQQQQ